MRVRRHHWVVILLVLLPVVSLLVVGLAFEQRITNWLADWTDSAAIWPGLLIVVLLSVDIVLPIPSSGVCTFAGEHLGVIPGILCCWLGLNISAGVGYGIGRAAGRFSLGKWHKPVDGRHTRRFISRFGIWAVVLTRPIPVIAEATTLLLGFYRFRFWRFAILVAAANLGIAITYVVLGHVADRFGLFPLAIVVAVSAPLLGYYLLKRNKPA